MGKKVGLFNLPAQVTCPGATKECKLICYARKAEKMYKTALNSRVKNLDESKNSSFKDLITEDLKKVKMVRVHESGDFYNQRYLNKWKEIWEENPDVSFLAFTKSYHLDFGELPPNVKIYNSIDSTTKRTPKNNFPTALTVAKREDVPEGYAYCPPIGKKADGTRDKTHYNICGDSCKICWTTTRNVAWTKH
jgi:hypothetical protein